MKKIFFLFPFFFVAVVNSQSVNDLWEKYNEGDYAYVIQYGEKLAKMNNSNLDLKLLLGRAYTDHSEFSKALSYLEYIDGNDHEKGWRIAWTKAYLGICYYYSGNYDKSKQYLKQSILLDATQNTVDFAKKYYMLFGFDKTYKSFVKKESDTVIFYFHPKTIKQIPDMEEFIRQNEPVYKEMMKNSESRKKTDVFIWDSGSTMHEKTDIENDYINVPLRLIHTVTGHEVTP